MVSVGDRPGGDLVLLAAAEAQALLVVDAEGVEARVQVGRARGGAEGVGLRADAVDLAVALDHVVDDRERRRRRSRRS